ncbi:phosphate ABC transporter substrate-binding protein PstS family protein [Pisciglobus halotolerans]|uniref:Phosphate-binding protein n=1 Tax=Pisciglobus halotolerans TaxID=745365 RepID=A0A1I3BK56_9LACT|nr:phosphate ABC transporter substrate-binding protein PstS family protein [Pisciglobus halotolerans]SFH62652.1 phosphate ABC transporter substrate-binding protein, PhoT family [Pisciglobus halotolerans]
MKLKKIKLLLTLAGLMLVATACGEVVDEESITAVGSSAMQPLVEAAGEQYSAENLGKFINVQGGGSGTGLSQIDAGAVDIGNSDIFAEESGGIDADKLVDHRIAVVGITPIVTPGTGVTDVTLEELRDIFTGKITNWAELGGKDLPITVLNRASGSGTRATFEQWVLGDEKSIVSQEQESSGTVRQIVANTPGTISYVAFSYVTDEVEALSINVVEPTNENVQNNDWIIWSYEHMYTNGEPEGLTKDFLDYMLSEDVQQTLIQALDYIPISNMKIERDVEGNTTPVQ